MIPKLRFFQTSSSSVLLRSVALAIVFIASASSSLAAEPVTLTCKIDDPSTETLTLRINYATALVEQLSPSGKPYTNRIAPNARISENAIVWSVQLMDTGLQTPVPMIWEGTLDRLSGRGSTTFSREPNWYPYQASFTCRQATQKF